MWLVWVVLVWFGVVVYFGLVLCVAMVRIFCSLDCSVYFWLCASDVGFAARVGGGFCVIVVGGFLAGSCFVGVGVFGSGVWLGGFGVLLFYRWFWVCVEFAFCGLCDFVGYFVWVGWWAPVLACGVGCLRLVVWGCWWV